MSSMVQDRSDRAVYLLRNRWAVFTSVMAFLERH
jgi:hypothetical protein